MDFKKLKTINRNGYSDNRAKDAIRCDRNEKVEDWDIGIFNNIIKDIKQHEYTSYPKDVFDSLIDNIAKYLNVKTSNIYISNGSDCVIRDFFIMYNQKIKNIGILSDTYGMYNVYPECLNMNKTIIPYIINKDLEGNIARLDKNQLYDQIQKIDCFCFVNPNQISNDDISFEELEDLCKKYPNKIFFIDEAYYGFGNYTAVSLTKKYKNIFVTRSFSKTFGLASLRIGILVGHEESIKPFLSLATIYCTNLFGDKIGNYFLENINIVEDYNKKVIEGREWFVKKLRSENFKVIDPKCLSIFVYCDNVEMQTKIYEDGINNLIYLKKWKMNDNKYFIRVSCGPINIMEKVFYTCFSKNFNK